MKFLKFFIPIFILYLIIFIFSILKLINYESFYVPEDGEFYSYESFKNGELIYFLLYKFVLNFPISIFNWFSNDFLYLTVFFIIPNTVVISYLITKIVNRR